ncbi:hypothetical protein M8C21_021564, partial [Ambrosia artemisiifolia]
MPSSGHTNKSGRMHYDHLESKNPNIQSHPSQLVLAWLYPNLVLDGHKVISIFYARP